MTVKKLLFYLSAVWVTAAFAYAFYEKFNEAGLYARLLGWQLETFGRAYITPTLLCVCLIYGSPGLIGLSLTRSAKTPPDPAAGQRNAAILLLSFGLLLILAGIGGYLIHLNYAAHQGEAGEAAARLVPVDLDTQTSPLSAGGADGLSVTGWLRRDVAYTLEEKGAAAGKKTVFCPFVGTRWTPSEPVKVFLRADPSAPIALHRPAVGSRPEGMRLPKGFVQVDFATATPLQATIEGTLRPGALPDYVTSSFNKQGIKAASDYMVLDARPFYDGPRRSEWDRFAMTSYLLTYITVPLGILIGLLSLIPFSRWRRIRAQQVSSRPR